MKKGKIQEERRLREGGGSEIGKLNIGEKRFLLYVIYFMINLTKIGIFTTILTF